MRKPSEAAQVWAVLGAGLSLRVFLAFLAFPGRGFRGDLELFADWSAAMASFGPGAFYANEATANYPPVYLVVLWPIGLVTPLIADLVGRDPVAVALVLAKLPAVCADIGIALLLFTSGRRWWSPRVGLGAAALFLVAPVVWFDSAVWGQVDSVAALPVLGALVLLADRRPAWAMACATLAVLVKPQSAVVLGVLVPVLVRRHLIDRRDFVTLLRSGFAATAVLLVATLPFDLEHFSRGRFRDIAVLGDMTGLWELYRSVGQTFDVLSANAYNGWALVGHHPLVESPAGGRAAWTSDSLAITMPLLGTHSAFSIGAGLLAVAASAVALPILVWRGVSESRVVLLLGHVVLATAFFALPTRVHERYLFPVFVTAALLAALALRSAVAYLLVSVTTTVNLQAVLTGPVNPGFDVPASASQPGPPTRVLSGVLVELSHSIGSWSRTLPVATTVSLVHTGLFLALLGLWSTSVSRARAAATGSAPAESGSPWSGHETFEPFPSTHY